MSSDEFSNDDLTENIKILATDDEKIKSFGEIFTNDSSREILQLLFNDDLTATQIAQKSDVSLQLVKYHLNKLQDLGVVKISKVEKNSKSQDMKIYTASKFSLVIVPPKLSDKTRESKLLVRSFRHIYKVTGFGIATGLSGLFSLSQIQKNTQIPIAEPMYSRELSSVEDSTQNFASSKSLAADESAQPTMAPVPTAESEMDLDAFKIPEKLKEESLDVVDITLSSGELITTTSDLFIPFLIITLILGGLTTYYLYKFFKKLNGDYQLFTTNT